MLTDKLELVSYGAIITQFEESDVFGAYPAVRANAAAVECSLVG